MKKLLAKKLNKIPAFSFIEIIVSVSLFIIIILSTTETFRVVIVGQRKAVASQNVQESFKYFLEASSKEIRMAKRNEGHCNGGGFASLGADNIYVVENAPNANGRALYFRNIYDECVIYYLGNGVNAGRFIVRRDGLEAPISPAKINISRLEFLFTKFIPGFWESRPLITMRLDAQAFSGDFGTPTYKELANMQIQTSLTSRAYR